MRSPPETAIHSCASGLALKQPWRHHKGLTLPDDLYLAMISPSAPRQKGNNSFVHLLIIQEAVGTWTQAPWVLEHPSSPDTVVQVWCQRQGRKQNSTFFFKKNRKSGLPYVILCVSCLAGEWISFSVLVFLCVFVLRLEILERLS